MTTLLISDLHLDAAHPAIAAAADIRITRDGRLTITLTHDSLAFALNEQPAKIADEPMLALLAGPREDLAAAFIDAVRIHNNLLELGRRDAMLGKVLLARELPVE